MPSTSGAAVTSAFDSPSRERSRADACPGALRLHAADDGALARVRLPGGLLTDRQANELAALAEELGDGHLDLTSRGNVQLRGLAPDAGTTLAERLGGAGMLPSFRHERARNVVASPLSGVDGPGHADVRAWTRELDGLLCADEEAAGLSGRFLFALDDGRGDVAALGADVTLIARPDGTAELHPGVIGDGDALLVPADQAPRWALRAAREFLRLAAPDGQRAWRVRDVDPDGRLLRQRLANDAGVRRGPALVTVGGAPALGVAGRGLSVGVPLGRVSAARWRALAATAADGSGELRVTPWRGVVIPGLPARRADAALEALRAEGFITTPDSPWNGVSCCTGRPGCAKSLADVRGDARDALAGAAVQVADGARLLPVHWSGCERRCGHPGGTEQVEVTATPDGYRVTADGTTRHLTSRHTPAAVAAARVPHTTPTRTM